MLHAAPNKAKPFSQWQAKKRQPYFIYPHYLKLYTMVVQKNRKNKEYQRIPLHYISAERNHMGCPFGRAETAALP